MQNQESIKGSIRKAVEEKCPEINKEWTLLTEWKHQVPEMYSTHYTPVTYMVTKLYVQY